jgi:hypothetical protein
MQKKLFTIILITFLPLISFALTTKQLAVSINLAGKQRMLSQKMTKEALLVKAGIDKKENLKKLKSSRDLFDKTLKGLQHGDKSLKLKKCKNSAVQDQLKTVQKIWKTFDKQIQKVLNNKADKSTYKKLQSQNMTLLKEMNKAVTLYVKQSKKGTSTRAQAVNLCGKERMLTQKIAKDLMFIANNIDVKNNSKDLKKTAKLFEKILKGLQHGDSSLGLEGTKLPKIQKQLKVGEKLFKEIKPTFKKSIKNKKTAQKTITKLDTLLVEMNKAVTLFEKSIKKEKQALKLSSIVGNYMKKKNIQNHIINLSGKQRMLTQKMTKLALLVSLGIDKKNNKAKLQKSTKQYDTTLEALLLTLGEDKDKHRAKLIKASKLYDKTLNGFLNGDQTLGLPATKNKKIIALIKKIQKEWKEFDKNIQKISDSEKKDTKALGFVISKNENLLKMSHQLVQDFKNSQSKQTFLEKARLNIVDVAGRQRMLTQKMTKEKLLILLKIDSDKNSKKLKKTIKLFDDSLKALRFGNKDMFIVKPSNKKIKKQLEKVAKLWDELKPLYLKKRLNQKELAKLVKENPILLAKMHKAVTLSAEAIDY